jgi:hypothetical protein
MNGNSVKTMDDGDYDNMWAAMAKPIGGNGVSSMYVSFVDDGGENTVFGVLTNPDSIYSGQGWGRDSHIFGWQDEAVWVFDIGGAQVLGHFKIDKQYCMDGMKEWRKGDILKITFNIPAETISITLYGDTFSFPIEFVGLKFELKESCHFFICAGLQVHAPDKIFLYPYTLIQNRELIRESRAIVANRVLGWLCTVAPPWLFVQTCLLLREY